MNYELAKQLKDAGFPQREPNGFPGILNPDGDKDVYYPTLAELIEACPTPLQLTIMPNGFVQVCWLGEAGLCCHYPNAEEAVAKLWLALQKK
jgi:hypothetical protein